MSCGAGRRHSSGPLLLWLWYRAAATALIQPLAWELSYAMGVALKIKTKKRKKEKWAEAINLDSSPKTYRWPTGT